MMSSRLILLIFVVLAHKSAEAPIFDQLRDSVTHEEQRTFIKINVLLDTSPRVVAAQLETALPQTHLAQSNVYKWYNDFKSGARTKVTDEPRPGKPRTVTTEANKERVRQLILESEGMRTDDLLYETDIPYRSLLRILDDLKAKKLKSRWLPHELTARQTQARHNIAGKHLARYQREPGFLDKIVAIDETWIKSDDPEDSRASSEWLLPEQQA